MKSTDSLRSLVAVTAIAVALPAGATDHYDGAFPPPVIAGVTRFAQTVPDVAIAETEVPPRNIWGVSTFPSSVVEAPLVDSAVPQPVVWVRWGVTKEAAEREAALASAAPGLRPR